MILAVHFHYFPFYLAYTLLDKMFLFLFDNQSNSDYYNMEFGGNLGGFFDPENQIEHFLNPWIYLRYPCGKEPTESICKREAKLQSFCL